MKHSVNAHYLKQGIFRFGLLIFFLSGCNSIPPDCCIKDSENIHTYHTNSLIIYDSSINCNINTDLYIDYSTCIAKAEEMLKYPEGQGTFYHDIRPKIIDCNPNFYSIKGKNIKKEEGDLYYLLRSVTEINYADIKAAAEKIVKNNNQAILITDGEYYEKGIAADHHNNPYLAKSFKEWLRQGNEIFILIEPYIEQNKYNKYRYYIIFTNSNIDNENNVYKKLYSAIEDYSPKIQCIHLSLTGLKLVNKQSLKDETRVNINLIAPGAYEKGSIEYHYPQIGWQDIWKYIKNGKDPNTGQQLPSGDFLFKGYEVDYSNVKYYQVTKCKLEVSNVYNEFREFEGSDIKYKSTKPIKLNNTFQIDQEHFNATNEIIIRVHQDFTGEGLNHEEGYRLSKGNFICDPDTLIKENLLRIDIVIDSVEDTFNKNLNDFTNFKWKSISKKNSGAVNESVYQSIKNVIEDESITPKIFDNGILYTIYLRTFPSDL